MSTKRKATVGGAASPSDASNTPSAKRRKLPVSIDVNPTVESKRVASCFAAEDVVWIKEEESAECESKTRTFKA